MSRSCRPTSRHANGRFVSRPVAALLQPAQHFFLLASIWAGCLTVCERFAGFVVGKVGTSCRSAALVDSGINMAKNRFDKISNLLEWER